MKATGIIRRVDDLGRVVIPKEIRKTCGIREGDPLEIYTDNIDGQPTVCFAKYEVGFVSSLTRLADRIDDELMDATANGVRYEIRDHFDAIAKLLKEWEEQ